MSFLRGGFFETITNKIKERSALYTSDNYFYWSIIYRYQANIHYY